MTSREHPREESETREEVVTTYDESYRVAETEAVQGRSRIAWGAIFAGTVVALVVMSLLNILGIAIGAIALESGAEGGGVSIGAGIWWTVSTLIALFAGGWIAGFFTGTPNKNQGLMHGLVTWGLFTIASMLAVMTAVGQLVGGVFGFVGQNVSTALAAIQPQNLEALAAEAGIEAQQAQEMEPALTAAGEQAMEALAIGAGWAFIALLLGALCAAIGGRMAISKPIDEEGRERTAKRRTRGLRPRRA